MVVTIRSQAETAGWGGSVMFRALLLTIGAVATVAAAPSKYSLLTTPSFQEDTVSLEQAGQAAASAGNDFTPAPLPNSDASAPILRTLGPETAQFTPGLFQRETTFRGNGYTPGSTVDGNEQRRFNPSPGINMKVPLQ